MQATKLSQGPICFAVVLYQPDDNIIANLSLLIHAVGQLVVIVNGSTSMYAELITFADSNPVELILNENNQGLSCAYNQALKIATQQQADYLCTLDQDSKLDQQFASKLHKYSELLPDDVVILGVNYFDDKLGRNAYKVNQNHDFTEVKTVISSGMLIDIDFLNSVDGFDERLFIDQVDHDICLKALKKQKRVFVANEILMSHTVGDEDGVCVPLIGNFPSHKAIRKYYICRNSLLLIRDNFLKQPTWALKRLVKLNLGILFIVFFDSNKIAKLKAVWLGFIDFIRHQYGRCSHII